MNASQKALEKFDRYLRAKYPLIGVCTHEESRVCKQIEALVTNLRPEFKTWKPRRIVNWSVTTGLVGADEFDPAETADNPLAAIRTLLTLRSDATPSVVLFKDFHPYLDNPQVIRGLRELAEYFRTSNHTAVFVSPAMAVPGDLEKTLVLIDWPLPDTAELAAVLAAVESNLPPSVPVTLNGNRERVVQSLQGLTQEEAQCVILNAVAATRSLGDNVIPTIIGEKKQIIRKSGVLEFYETDVNMNQVGGLSNLKSYSTIKRATFSEKAKAAGVEPAKGVLLVGVPGTGKSLSAKAIAGGTMPLLRMDIGSLFGGLVGESEKNMRAALKVAEAVAPAVLWIDEIEKALGGMGGGEHDGGTSTRVFGTLLTWMQETTAPIYVVATANDVRGLRPELLRRFDDIFWVDMPCHEDRVEILKVHLSKRGKPVEDFNLEQIADAVHGFTGAEIEKVVKAAIELAFVLERDMTTEDLVNAASEIVPIAVTMGDQINELRGWAKTRARNAGKPFDVQTTKKAETSTLEV